MGQLGVQVGMHPLYEAVRARIAQGFENVLGRRLPVGPVPRAEGVAVLRSPAEELDAWIEVVTTGFASPDEQGVASHESFPRDLVATVMADMASAEGFSCWLARRDGVPAGGASLRLFEGVAHLCGAATLPDPASSNAG